MNRWVLNFFFFFQFLSPLSVPFGSLAAFALLGLELRLCCGDSVRRNASWLDTTRRASGKGAVRFVVVRLAAY